MATGYYPMVLVAGEIQELPAGGYIAAPVSGGEQITRVNDEATPQVLGNPVYFNDLNGVLKARANADSTGPTVIGFAAAATAAGLSGPVAIDGLFEFGATAAVDAICGTTGGFSTAGARVWLSTATAGLLQLTAPSGSGNWSVPVGRVATATSFFINFERAVKLR